jgi:DMSO reductase family type II enzyme chaperone
MPTPFEETRSVERGTRRGDWAARSDAPKRSVFGNYADTNARNRPREEARPSSDEAGESGREDLQLSAATRASGPPGDRDAALARSFLYRFLAQAYEDPTPEGWAWLGDAATQESLRRAWDAMRNGSACPPGLGRPCAGPAFAPEAFDSFHSAYVATFGHAARGRCPLNETEYGDLKADPLFQPHRLADLAAFYRAFGLGVAEDAGERQDHLCLELEFMCVLAAKEAFALEHQLGADALAQGREAQKKFLREHLGRWTPAFTRRLVASTDHPTLAALAGFTRAFVESECARFGVTPGSEDLLLRPVSQADESLCDACGAARFEPGLGPTPAPA